MGKTRDTGNLVDTTSGINTGDTLADYTTTNPSAPASGLTLFSRYRAGKRVLAQKNPIEDSEIQSHMGFKRIMWVEPVWGSTTSTFCGIPSQNAVGATLRNVLSTNFSSQTRRVGFVTAGTSGSVAAVRMATPLVWRGNASGFGGFYVVMKFGVPNFLSGGIYFIGLSPGTAIAAATEASANTDIIGVGKDTGDTNFQIMCNDASGTATKIDTGVTPAAGQIYALRIFCLPNDSIVYISLENVVTSTVIYDGSLSSNIPASATLLGYIYHASNSATASVTGVDQVQFYAETN